MRERKASTCAEDDDEQLSLGGPMRPVVVDEGEQRRGVNAAGGSVTLTTWRAPNGK